jgi:hypothetical protein
MVFLDKTFNLLRLVFNNARDKFQRVHCFSIRKLWVSNFTDLNTPISRHLTKVLLSEGYLDGIEEKISNLTATRDQDLDVARVKVVEKLKKIDLGIKKTIEVQTQCADVIVDDAFKDRLRVLSEEKRASKVLLDEIDNLKSD